MFLLLSLVPPGNGFGTGPNPDALRAWIERQRPRSPTDAATALRPQLLLVRRTPNRHARLRMLDMLLPPTLGAVAGVEQELLHVRHPLSLKEKKAVLAANDLLKLHASAYRETVVELSNKWLGLGFSRLLPRAVAQGMELECRRLTLAYRAYSPGSKSAWKSLHQLYRLARAGGFADAVADGLAASPTTLYAKSLLLAFAEPSRLGSWELDRLVFYLDRHAALAELHDAASALHEFGEREGCFLIRRRDDTPSDSLRRRGAAPAQGADLLLDCGPLLKRLRAQLDGIEHAAQPSKLGLPAVARRPHYVAMLRNVLALWSAPPQRRHARQQFRPRIDLVTGFDDLWIFIAGPAFRRRRSDPPLPPTSPPPNISEWSITNEGATGFALQYLNGKTSQLTVGALAGLRPKDRSVVHLCVVRRLVAGDQRPELGLEKLAGLALPTTVRSDESSRGADDARMPAIVLLNVPTRGGGAAVLARAGQLRSGTRVTFRKGRERLRGIVGTPMEHGPNFELFALDLAD